MSAPVSPAGGHPPELLRLDNLLADLDSADLRATSVTPRELHRRLVNELWWRVCAEAAVHDPGRIVDWYRGTDERIAAVLTEQGDAEADDQTLLMAARAIAGVGVALAAGRGAVVETTGAGALQRAISYWSTAGILPELPPDTRSGHQLLTADSPPGLQAVDATLQQMPATPARSMTLIAAVLLAGGADPQYLQQVRVLFDSRHAGQVGHTGTLELAMLPGGPPGLYPDPRTMGFLRADHDFATALTTAWAYAAGKRPHPPCVLWSIQQDGGQLQPINGGSLGAAFAVALSELLQRGWLRWLSLQILQTFRTQCAVTGTVTADGAIGRVSGIAGKFDAAHRRAWIVVAPKASFPDGNRGVPHGLSVYWADTVREARRKLRRWVRWRTAAAVLVVLLAAAGVVIDQAWQRLGAANAVAQRNAHAQERTATVDNLLREADALSEDQPVTALRLGLAATALEDSAKTRAGLVNTLASEHRTTTLTAGHGAVRVALLGPRDLALTVDDSGAVLWNVSDRNQPRRLAAVPEPMGVTTAAMDEDGRTLMLIHSGTSSPSSVEVDDITNPSAPRKLLDVPSCGPRSVAVHGTVALLGCPNGTVGLWRLTGTGMSKLADLASVHGVHAVALSGTGTRAMVASDSGLAVWDITAPTHPAPVSLYRAQVVDGPAYAVRSDDDGEKLLVGHASGTAELVRLNMSDQRRPVALRIAGRTGTVLAVDISRDGRLALTAGEGAAATLWEYGRTRDEYLPRVNLTGHTDAVDAVSLSPDGRTALTGSLDGTALLWDITDRGQYSLGAIMDKSAGAGRVSMSAHTRTAVTVDGAGHAAVWDATSPGYPRRVGNASDAASPIRVATFSPVVDVVATGSDNGAVALWDLTVPRHPIRLTQSTQRHEPVGAIAFNPTGTKMATGSDSGEVALWDIADSTRLQRVGAIPGIRAAVKGMAFTRTGTVLAVGAADDTITMWNTANPARPVRLATIPTPGVRAVAVNPATATLLEADDSGALAVQWDIGNPGNPRRIAGLPGNPDPGAALAYNADGTMAVVTDQGGTASVWSVIDPGHPHLLGHLTGHTSPVLSAAFSADGGTVLTSAADNTVILWDIARLAGVIANPKDTACQVAERGLNPTEWAQYVPTLPYQDSCPG